ncbi:ATPase [Syntrophotalea acetylenivorans]|uniref:ATPase n=1 Tax=Syntrophotalea acetylenivorans TaxID=1842532 RepID=A0A1L3GRC6_9BACT|nr:MoxR family ATPase [Syntrophotalea acetylenivorans]APG28410.1 ATPase [Syntrophotalea acetylenivorans]
MTSAAQSPDTDTRSQSESFRRQLQQAEAEISKVIIGQQRMIQTIFCALLARGHVLLEGVPGLAKSLTVATFARLIGGTFKRIQFTPDKLPSDITGTTVYNQATSTFSFNQGPVFCNILLADEINRAAPKVQSALLEAMQEKVVSIDRDQHPLPELFMVLATMNPVEQLGTYPLSEAQLDRFIAKVELSYPAQSDEAQLLHKKSRNFEALQKAVPQLLTTTQALAMQNHVADKVSISDRVINYLLEICLRTRPQSIHANSAVRKYITVGVSPRGGEHLIAFCKGHAFLEGRDFVSFEDVDACAAEVLGHRLILSDAAFLEGIRPTELIREIISGIIPY